jgi:hypothetical protein
VHHSQHLSSGICLTKYKTPRKPVHNFKYQNRRCMGYDTCSSELSSLVFYGLIRSVSINKQSGLCGRALGFTLQTAAIPPSHRRILTKGFRRHFGIRIVDMSLFVASHNNGVNNFPLTVSGVLELPLQRVYLKILPSTRPWRITLSDQVAP